MYSTRNRQRPTSLAGRRARPRRRTREGRATPAHLLVSPFTQAIEPADIRPGLSEAPTLTAEAVFHRHAGQIYSIARRMLPNAADAEDVTQDVLLSVVRKLDTFRGESELSTWLHRVTVNAALAYRHKRARQLAHETSTPLQHLEDGGRPGASGDEPDKHLIDREIKERIEEAVRGLPETYREPFVLSDIEGLPNAEIGELLGLSLPAVKSRLHRARRLLQSALKPHCEELHHLPARARS